MNSTIAETIVSSLEEALSFYFEPYFSPFFVLIIVPLLCAFFGYMGFGLGFNAYFANNDIFKKVSRVHDENSYLLNKNNRQKCTLSIVGLAYNRLYSLVKINYKGFKIPSLSDVVKESEPCYLEGLEHLFNPISDEILDKKSLPHLEVDTLFKQGKVPPLQSLVAPVSNVTRRHGRHFDPSDVC